MSSSKGRDEREEEKEEEEEEEEEWIEEGSGERSLWRRRLA